MALLSQSIKNLKGGISQQPEVLRFPEQGSEQVNGWSSEAEGLQKRPPLIHIKALGDSNYIGNKPHVHLINRDEVERYFAVFTGTEIRVFDLQGKEYAVRGNRDYVRTENPRDDLRTVTVADYTFVVNRKKVVKINESSVNLPDFRDTRDGLINVRGGQYGRRLTVSINNKEYANLLLPDGSNANQSPQVDAQAIVNTLATQLRKNLGNPTNTTDDTKWRVETGTGYIQIIAPKDNNIKMLTTTDGYADQLINPVTHYVQSFQKLPLNAPDGYIVKIVGDTSKSADQYYVKYDAARKVWSETLGWNQQMDFDWDTLPWALVRSSDGNFDFKRLTWSSRVVGEDKTNPFPSFVDQTINDIFFFRNRLGFLSGENIILSRTAKYFNFFPASIANLSDDDPIDVAVSHNRVSVLKYAVPFAEELLLWSDQAQFVLSAPGILSSRSVSLDLTTQFDVKDSARPAGVGRNVYFASPRASYTAINRYYAIQDTTSVKGAEDVTAHVPSYIPNGVFSISGSTTENFAAILTSGAKSKIYIYKFLYIDEAIQQQSWSHWDLGDNITIYAAHIINSEMTVMLGNEYSLWMGRFSFAKHTVDIGGEPYRIHLDSKIKYIIPSGKYDMDSNLTTINIMDAYGMRFSRGKVSIVFVDGLVLTSNEPVGGWEKNPFIRLPGNREGETVFIGFTFNFKYTFSKFLIKRYGTDGATSTEDIGRLQLRRAWVNYEASGAFTVRVINKVREYSYVMAGGRIGSRNLRVSKVSLGTGQYRFPVAGNAEAATVSIDSDATTPLTIIGCGWEGAYVRRSSGI